MLDGCRSSAGRRCSKVCRAEPFGYFVLTECGIKKKRCNGDLEAGIITRLDRKIAEGDNVPVLRDNAGVPVWSGWRR
jgi:uncharacterized metal-binding protein